VLVAVTLRALLTTRCKVQRFKGAGETPAVQKAQRSSLVRLLLGLR
jgi:hypothetical protein